MTSIDIAYYFLLLITVKWICHKAFGATKKQDSAKAGVENNYFKVTMDRPTENEHYQGKGPIN
ncbi:MAG: hypothetical protein JWO03_2474 [Bacteroidetes bacterium]|nr:hypothetical protein [Bacteroidota bacterium]